MFPIRMRKLDNISVRKRIVGKLDSWAFGDKFSFNIKIGVYEKLAKNNDCSTKTYAAPLAATSIFRTGLRLALALAMCADLAYSVRRSWCGLINSPTTTFAVVIKPLRGRLSLRRGPVPKLFWTDLYHIS